MIDLPALAELTSRHAADLALPVAPFAIGPRQVDTDATPVLMGVVNLSADSWYRESVALSREQAVGLGTVQRAQGADVVDVGAESVVETAERVGAERQREQLVPVVADLVAAGVPVSVESYHPDVVGACLEAGATVLNLTGSARDEEMFALAARHGASVVLCHVGGTTPRDLDGGHPARSLDDLFDAMLDSFAARLEHARASGVTSVAVDPGVGFSMPWLTTAADRYRYQALALVQGFRLRRLGVPVCNALPAAPAIFGPEVRTAEGFFAVLAALGRTGIHRTHEVPRVAAVLRAMREMEVLDGPGPRGPVGPGISPDAARG